MSSLEQTKPPIVMSFSGHDPSGGAGIQADIETLTSLGCHCTPIVTALTAQDSVNVKDFSPTNPTLLVEQARAVLEDMPIAAFKCGMIGSVENVEAIHTILHDYPDTPVILDPVLKAGGGGNLAEASLVDAIRHLLIPYCTVITPNSVEARTLYPDADSLDACAQGLMDDGCHYVLITGGHEPTSDITNRLWGQRQCLDQLSWPREEGEFHGTGCTLASAIAGYIARGNSVELAVKDAQQYTASTIQHARRLGMGQLIPNRYYWADLGLSQPWKKVH
ncbi:hydroxymethylpyrimidine/phosphomethylpyrimidine kinase [Gammaproteobacteria bacterium 45_16_T64]|nr:hydroxymethylpyrimidine/phosphomethylpyrimidine kinase [Gammaproteobacteria bacterium 45_16_T64]